MDEEVKNRLRRWKEKAKGVEIDHWVRFIIHWMIFDACLAELSKKDFDKDRLDWFYNNPTDLKEYFRKFWGTPKYVAVLGYLKDKSPIKDLRPSKRNNRENDVYLKDTTNEKEVFDFIYQIRCNTFHGGKNLADGDDNQLTRLSEQLLYEPLERFLNS